MNNTFEVHYKRLLQEALFFGELKPNRTGVDTLYLFNKSLTIDLTQGFPILTSKRIFFDKALAEYNWMTQGLTHLTYLHQHGITWWDEFADEKGYLGKTYGYQMRSFNGEVDQFDYLHREIKANSRRAHMTLWNPSELNETKLPPCYTGFTFSRCGDNLNMTIQLRSSDMFLGLPYDIIVASLMLTDIAKFNDLTPKNVGLQITDAHLYVNHLDQTREYIKNPIHSLPELLIKPNGERLLVDYQTEELIKAKLNN